jgi:hypothetical protein
MILLVSLVLLTWWIWWVRSVAVHHRKATTRPARAFRSLSTQPPVSTGVDLIDTDPDTWTTLDDTQLARLLRDSAP